MIKPKLNENRLTQHSFFSIYDTEDYILQEIKVANEFIENQEIEHPVVECCLFTNVVFSENMFQRMEFIDCKL